MQPRADISDNLVHFTSGKTDREAFERLARIVRDGRLVGGNGKIKGAYTCVCFTEAPLNSLQHGLVNPTSWSRYSPFGVIFEKRWVYQQGGRPVIYQSDDEFADLPDKIKWRHVRYEPHAGIDFTWEREWRIRTEALNFAPNVAGIVLPDGGWAQRLIDLHNDEQDFQVRQYAQIMDEELGQQYRERFPWRVYLLR